MKDELSLADAPWLLDVDLDYFGVDSPASELAERGATICYKFWGLTLKEPLFCLLGFESFLAEPPSC